MNYISVLSRLYYYYVFIDSTAMQIKIYIESLESEQNLKTLFFNSTLLSFLLDWRKTELSRKLINRV